jgi:translation elongation factor EF-1beta
MKKSFFYLVFLLLLASNALTQENPWLPKGENPWGHYENTKKTENPSPETETKNQNQPVVDTVKTETILTKNENQPIVDSIKILEIEIVDSVQKSENELYSEAGMVAQDAYISSDDFMLGYLFGVVTATGLIPSLLCVYTDNKQEKQLVKEIESRPRYEKLDNKKLNRQIKNKVKNKKLKSTLVGALAGFGTKAIIFYVILTS